VPQPIMLSALDVEGRPSLSQFQAAILLEALALLIVVEIPFESRGLPDHQEERRQVVFGGRIVLLDDGLR
jgi:hypothetical protein